MTPLPSLKPEGIDPAYTDGPYYVVPMPINARGHGPEMDPDEVQITLYEVWNGHCLSLGQYPNEPLAKFVCDALNRATLPSPAEDVAKVVATLRKKRMRVHDLSGVGWEDDPDCHRAATFLLEVAAERDALRGETFKASADAAEYHRDNAISMWDAERKARTAAEASASSAIEALELIVNGDVGGSFSGSQCVDIARAALTGGNDGK